MLRKLDSPQVSFGVLRVINDDLVNLHTGLEMITHEN